MDCIVVTFKGGLRVWRFFEDTRKRPKSQLLRLVPTGQMVPSLLHVELNICLPQFAWRNTCNNAVFFFFLGGMTQNQASSRKFLKIMNPLSPGGLLEFGHPWPSLGWSFGGSSHWAGHFDPDDLKFPISELAPYYINIYCIYIYITYTHSVCIYIYLYLYIYIHT